MGDPRSLRDAGSRVERLLDELHAEEPAVAERAEEVVRLLVELYGAGLERICELVAEHPGGADLLAGMARDELVSSLLLLHGLHPVDLDTRIQRALETVRPYLGSHAGGVTFLGVDPGGVARLRLEGSCDGCPSSTVTVKLAIERAIGEAAPELAGIEVEGVAEPGPRGAQLLQIQPWRKDCPAEPAVETGRP